MIRVTLLTAGEQITGFECNGHAGFAEAGRDIVCAAASILTVTCANALETVARVKPRTEAREGYMRLSLPPEANRDAQIILLAMRQGFRDLAEAYPQYLTLTEHSA